MKSSYVIKRVLKYIGKYKFSFINALVLTLFSTVCTLYIPVLAGDAIDMIAGKGNVNFAGLTKILILILVAIIIGGISQYFTNTLNNRMANNTVKDMRTDAFNNLQYVPVSYIDSRNTGDIVSRVIADAEQFSDGLILGFQNLFSGVITILGTLFFMFTINIWLALIVLVLTPLSLFVSKFISKRTYKYFKKQSEQRGKETSYIEEMLSNIKVVKSYHREDENYENFDVINEELGKDSLNATFFSSLTNPCTRFVNSIVYAVVGLSGALFAINGIITVGNLSASLAYANQYTKPFNDITGVITELQNAIACAGRSPEVIDAKRESDAKGALPSNVKGDFTVSDVAFSYDKNKELIKNLSFELKSGQRLAVVGPTGCGETTLINLLMHFYDIDSGSIKVDGVDINTVSRKSLRQNVGMVLQDTWLKAGTIRAWGVSNYSAEQLSALLAAARAENIPQPSMCQPPLSLLNTGALDALLPLCEQEGVGVIPYQVLQGGLLTGKYRAGQQPPAGSRAAEKPDWMKPMTDEVCATLARVEAEAKAAGQSMTQYALAWALRQPAVRCVLLGVKREAQLDEAAAIF